MSKRQHLVAILVLPTVVTIIVPLILTLIGGYHLDWLFPTPLNAITVIIGLIVVNIGLSLLVQTNRLFASVGEGTLAPWSPTKKLVVHGVYRYTRNPMILGVLTILLGEAVLLGSLYIFLWLVFFWIGNHIYFTVSEEPGLVERFGSEYLIYKQNVPRWFPRLTPWDGEEKEDMPSF